MSEEPKKRMSAMITEARTAIVQSRSLVTEIRFSYPGWRDRVEHVEGALTCAISSLYQSLEELMAFEIKQDDEKFGPSLRFSPRGIGLDSTPGCFVCGDSEEFRKRHYADNIAAFVLSKEEGDKIVKWFGQGARLDYRSFEPHRIQIKVGTCEGHLPNLQKLLNLTSFYGRIRENDIAESRVLREGPIPTDSEQPTKTNEK